MLIKYNLSTYNFDLFIFFIKPSSFIAKAIFPLILSFPNMKAWVGLSFPVNIFTKSSLLIVILQSTSPSGGSPWPIEPDLFFKSKYQSSSRSPRTNNNEQFKIVVKKLQMVATK